MWEVVHRETGKAKGHTNYDIILKQDQQTVKCPNRKANIFNKFFLNVTSELKLRDDENKANKFLNKRMNRVPNSLFLKPTSPSEICKIL